MNLCPYSRFNSTNTGIKISLFFIFIDSNLNLWKTQTNTNTLITFHKGFLNSDPNNQNVSSQSCLQADVN